MVRAGLIIRRLVSACATGAVVPSTARTGAHREAEPGPPASSSRYWEMALASSGHSWITDRKSTRLNSSHLGISYAVFCLKKEINSTLQAPSGTTLELRGPVVNVGTINAVYGTVRFHSSVIFFFNDTATTEIYTLSLHDALPI